MIFWVYAFFHRYIPCVSLISVSEALYSLY
jgi:hypothetical protein